MSSSTNAEKGEILLLYRHPGKKNATAYLRLKDRKRKAPVVTEEKSLLPPAKGKKYCHQA